MVVDADHLRHGSIALLAQVAVPLRHGIPVAGHQVEAGVPHLAEAAHQRERTFELLQSVVGFVDLGVVDIQHQEVDQFAVHVVQHGHLGIYLHAAFLAGGIVAAQSGRDDHIALDQVRAVAEVLQPLRTLRRISSGTIGFSKKLIPSTSSFAAMPKMSRFLVLMSTKQPSLS